jgi:cytochrome c-type biogenesis protein CcmH
MGDSLMAEARAEPAAESPAEPPAEPAAAAAGGPTQSMQQSTGLAPAPAPAPPTDPDAIQLSVTLAPGLDGKLTGVSPLFIFARGTAGGPPLAVIRRGSNELPLTIEMSDANAMMQGVKISAMPELQLVARVSLSGSPAAKPGDLFGEVKYSRDSGQQAAIVIDQVVE